MGVGHARPPRYRSGSLTILAVIAAISIGLPAVDHAQPASRTVTTGVPYPVGAGVSVVPPPGSMVDLGTSRFFVDHGRAAFRLGSVRYLVVVGPYLGTVDAAAYWMRERLILSMGYQMTVHDCLVITNSGLIGRQGRYRTWGRSGLYAVFVVNGLRIEVTASGSDPRLRVELSGIKASIRSIAYQRPR
jgi:hypothetical protein